MYLNDLVKLFFNFHSIFIATASMRGPLHLDDLVSLSKLILLTVQDQRPLFRCLFALATGKLNFDALHLRGLSGQSEILPPALATDILARVLMPAHEIGPTIRFLTFVLESFKSSKAHNIFASPFQLCLS